MFLFLFLFFCFVLFCFCFCFFVLFLFCFVLFCFVFCFVGVLFLLSIPFFTFVFSNFRELICYKNEIDDPATTKETPKSKISLAACRGIKPITDKKYPFSFEIDLGKKGVVFACDQPDERESWIHHLRRFAVLHGKD